jgi:hypothetical protein
MYFSETETINPPKVSEGIMQPAVLQCLQVEASILNSQIFRQELCSIVHQTNLGHLFSRSECNRFTLLYRIFVVLVLYFTMRVTLAITLPTHDWSAETMATPLAAVCRPREFVKTALCFHMIDWTQVSEEKKKNWIKTVLQQAHRLLCFLLFSRARSWTPGKSSGVPFFFFLCSTEGAVRVHFQPPRRWPLPSLDISG